jgi:hypothetical protein
MLRLWIDAISTKDAPSIVRVADLVRLHDINQQKECYQDRARSLRRRSLGLSVVLCTIAEDACAYSMLSAAVKPFNLLDAFVMSLSAPVIGFLAPPASRLQVVSVFASQMLSLPFYSRRYFGINPGILKLVEAATVSCVQVKTINDATGVAKLTLPHFVATAGTVFLSHLFRRSLIKFVSRDLHISIAFVIACFAEFFFSHITYELAEYGLRGALEMLGDALLFCESPPITGHVLPLTFEAPQSLQCMICHELVADPVMVSGFLSCRSCLSSWIEARQDYIHPLTGEYFCFDDIRPSGIYRCLVWNYYRAISQADEE